MALNIIVSIHDDNTVDVRDTLCQYWSMPDFGGSNVGQKNAFLKSQLASYVKSIYSQAKGVNAAVPAHESAVNIALQADIT